MKTPWTQMTKCAHLLTCNSFGPKHLVNKQIWNVLWNFMLHTRPNWEQPLSAQCRFILHFCLLWFLHSWPALHRVFSPNQRCSSVRPNMSHWYCINHINVLPDFEVPWNFLRGTLPRCAPPVAWLSSKHWRQRCHPRFALACLLSVDSIGLCRYN